MTVKEFKELNCIYSKTKVKLIDYDKDMHLVSEQNLSEVITLDQVPAVYDIWNIEFLDAALHKMPSDDVWKTHFNLCIRKVE